MLEIELAVYELRQAESAELHLGDFDLIEDETLEGFYRKETLAYIAGKSKFKKTPFLIKQVFDLKKERLGF